ncbi:MAG: beta-galactosidase [Phocaeicola sp.]|uniref:beta-galactosidase n=1 Tax=Phocaeicola sp. TaxID=2773926 RepID=UPI003FA178AC
MKKHLITILGIALAVNTFANNPVKDDKIYHFDKPLYGAAYYSEYTPTDRLDEDIRLMKEAGLTVVRVGESTWSLFEPQDGIFKFEWMDRILNKMYEAGIQVILGTPTYSIPSWMAAEHPEVLSHTWQDKQSYYGIRQNMDLKNPTYLKYCERIIRKMMEHFANHPAIIGYQVDNEVEARNIDNQDYFEGFRDYIKKEFNHNLDSLNHRWGLNYWGMNINNWSDFYDRKGVTNPSYKLWWERWNRKVTADFLNWQINIVNEYKRPDQFVTHCFMPAFANIDQVDAFRQMEYPAINVYYNMQDAQDGMQIGYAADYMRVVSKKHNFLVTETNAQGTGWSSQNQWPPYDGQLRQNMYAFLSGGANMVEYWHWSTLHYGQETYWRGVLGHEGLPNRVYAEFSKGAKELDNIGDQLVNLKKHNKVALLFSHDSKHALDFMPYANSGTQYKDYMMYEALYKQNIECDIIPVDKIQDFSGYEMLIIPSLYIATDELLHKISNFVKNGGEVVMLYKSGYCDQDDDVRTSIAPGPLADACGFTYQEFSSINKLSLKGNEIGASDNTIDTWMEFLQLGNAKPLAYADHVFFGKWPCITENSYGKGHLIYIGTNPSMEILEKLIARAAKRKNIATVERNFSFPIVLRSGINEKGKKVHYLFNFSYETKTIAYPYGNSQSLLDSQQLNKGTNIQIDPWGVVIGIE